jgi:serine phosphatase RsbU (regulator of sigma subunit)
MKVVILDRNKSVLEYFSLLLKDFDVEVETFTKEKECIKFLNENGDVDFIFVEDFFYKDFLEKYLEAFLIILSFKIDELLINRIYDNIKKDILPLEFKTKFGIIKKLREYVLKEKKEKKELTEVISYKTFQEEMATKKQLKLFIDELAMFYENDFFIETFYEPIDILSGDALITKRIDENKYFLAIIDAMGKGLSASLTSSNSVGFLHYALLQALKHNDFDFHRIVESFVNYGKSILIEDEALCFIIGYIENNKFYFVNCGMPPIYVDRKKIRANNMPLSEWSNDIYIDQIEFKKDILMYSDGLIESETKDGDIYLRRFQKLLLDFEFLNDFVKDFNKNAIQSDDVTVIYVKKDDMEFKKIYEKEIDIFSKEDIDNFLKEFNIEISNKEKIEFTLHELLMNSYEHGLLNLKQLKNSFLREDKKECINEKSNIKVKIKLFENSKFIKLYYGDNGKGFDIGILKYLSKDKLHGRGIKMIKFMSDGMFYSVKCNEIVIFFRK